MTIALIVLAFLVTITALASLGFTMVRYYDEKEKQLSAPKEKSLDAPFKDGPEKEVFDALTSETNQLVIIAKLKFNGESKQSIKYHERRAEQYREYAKDLCNAYGLRFDIIQREYTGWTNKDYREPPTKKERKRVVADGLVHFRVDGFDHVATEQEYALLMDSFEQDLRSRRGQ